MHLNTRIFLTTGYARVLLFMFIRKELGGMVKDVYFSLHTVIYAHSLIPLSKKADCFQLIILANFSYLYKI